MFFLYKSIILFLMFLFSPLIVFADDSLDAVKQKMIRMSIASYSGSCPCPYSINKAGRRCGKRSAYLKPGGKAPFCYSSDITDEQARRLRGQGR